MNKRLFTLGLFALCGVLVACGGPTSSSTPTSDGGSSSSTSETSNPPTSTPSNTTTSVPDEEDVTTCAEAKQAADGATITNLRGVVVASTEKALVLRDETGYVYVYKSDQGFTSPAAVGAYVRVDGTADDYQTVMQVEVTNDSDVTVLTETAPTLDPVTPVAWTATEVDAYAANADDIHYVSMENATLVVSQYENFTVEGSSVTLSFAYLPSDLEEIVTQENNGRKVNLECYVVGVTSGRINVIATDIELLPETDPEPDPDPSDDKTIVIDPSNFNSVPEVITRDVVENTQFPQEFNIKPDGFLISNNISDITKIEVFVYGQYDNLEMYAGLNDQGTKITATSTESGDGKIYTYTFDGTTDEFFLVNPSTYTVNVYSITIYYTGERTGTTNETPLPEEPEPVDPTTADAVTYEFGDYPPGVQYAENEVHTLDTVTTVTTNIAHFTNELRLYDSDSNDSTAIIATTRAMYGISFNAGNKNATLNVTASTDGVDFSTTIADQAVTSSYADYTLSFDTTYQYIKLDAVGAQIRVKSITLYFAPIADAA